MGGFEFLDHTADVRVVATGRTLGEALSWAAKGMFSLIFDADKIEPRQSMELSVASADSGALVVDWLNELLYRHEAEGFLPREFQVLTAREGRSLVATCTGEPLDLERHHVTNAVKAATYHGLRVSHDGEWRIEVTLDI